MNRPRVFISTVSRELRGARQRVANILARRGYEPVWQDIFGTEPGDLRDMLREKVASCHGLIQIIGDAYGFEPPVPEADFGRCSYTQFEFLHARKLGKKTWLLIAGPGCVRDTPPAELDLPDDPAHPDPAAWQSERQQLQRDYRQRAEVKEHLRHTAENDLALDLAIERLDDQLAALRKEFAGWQRNVLRLAAVVVLLAGIILGSVWWGKRGQDTGFQTLNTQIAALTARLEEKERSGAPDQRALQAVGAALKAKGGKTDAESVAEAEEDTAKKLGIGIEELRTQLAKAKDNAAERLRLTAELATLAAPRPGANAREEKLRAETRDLARRERVWALQHLAAGEHLAVHYAEATRLLREAESLTDKQSNEGEWAGIQVNLADVELDNGHYASAERRYRAILPGYQRENGPEAQDTLSIRNNLAGTLFYQGVYAEAEAEFRAVGKLYERVVGPEHPGTLNIRTNLALALAAQDKYAEAEAEYRALLRIQERVFGPEHPGTLRSRGNLALVLDAQGENAVAEAEFRAVLELYERVLGPEHPDTLRSRTNLAGAAASQRTNAENEAEYRAVLVIQERVLGPEHPDTLRTLANISLCVRRHDRKAALAPVQRAFEGAKKVLGPEHPETKEYQKWVEMLSKPQ